MESNYLDVLCVWKTRPRRRLNVMLLYLFTCVWVVCGREKLYGLHSDELISGELIVPRKVTEHGAFLSHNVTHFHRQHYRDQQYRRTRRSLAAGEEMLHYQLDINNETLHLELEPHSYFMTPHLIVERHRRDLRTRNRPLESTNCHFHGKVRGHEDSRVAVSTCGGLVGHIKTKDHEYYIEPSKVHRAHADHGHPHVAFQRSSVREKPNNNNNNNSNNGKRKVHKHKHQQHQQHQQQLEHQPQRSVGKVPKRTLSNCGTKEPRRRVEARLVEWQPRGKVKIQGGRRIRRMRHHGHHQPYHHHHHHHHHQQQQQHDIASKTAARTGASTTTKEQQQFRKYQEPRDAEVRGSSQHYASTDALATKSTARTPATHEQRSRSHHSRRSHRSERSRRSRERTKRSISSPRHVETLVVADATMVAFHSNIETYLLTIMNMVSALYKDPSIGNSIEIVVVKIVLLEEDEAHPDLNLTQNAQQNLDTFCSWQHQLNTDNELDPHHHDVAILITRKNICGNNCMTLGLANVGGMCKPKKSCSVNEDNGIMLSHTIAHELGHNFGMFHDTAKIGCHPRVGSIVHIMTPTFGADTLQVCWSNCSRKYITHFLDQGLGECLDDAPTSLNRYSYPDQPPGVMFNAELQCRLQYNVTDSAVRACSSLNEICATLWCQVNGECVTNMRPTAPGTMCGKRKWCQNGKCVRMEEMTPVNGGWGNWSEWSECSRSCGGGVSIQQRECDSPLPANGGLFCIGERKRYKICHHQPCPAAEPSFRAQQCAQYNDVPYQGTTYQWLPFFDKKNPCKLFCTDVDDTIIANWGDVVLDGTPCTLGTNNMCIDGICKKVGCDWTVDSDLQEDRCGVCGGSGDQCQPVRSLFNGTFGVAEGYVQIAVLPARARHIVVREESNSPHFLAVARANSSTFYLNGDSLISMPGEFVIAGAESLYDRVDERETIHIPQPIEHSIAIYAIVRGSEPNGGIYYEFTLPAPAQNRSSADTYLWKLSEWTACTTSCGGGVQYREPICWENDHALSETELCWLYAQNGPPARPARQCNVAPCPAHWWTGPWQFCPVTCRATSAPAAVRRRTVMCLDQHDVVLEDSKCNAATRPPEVEYCDKELPSCSDREPLGRLQRF